MTDHLQTVLPLKQTHSKETFLYSISRTFERASYYGIRSILLLYMVGTTINISAEDTRLVYSWFIGSIIVTQIIGAVLGDLVLGNKRALIIGGLLQALGAFSFCIPSIAGIYTGLALISLGTGLYSPNILSQFGKLYLKKQKLLDAGFMIFYVAINIGAFIGPVVLGYFGSQDYQLVFIVAGILMLISVCIPLFLKEVKSSEIIEKKMGTDSRILTILITVILLGLFWAIYEVGSSGVVNLELKFSQRSALQIPASMWYTFSTIFLLPVGIIAAIVWSYIYNSQFIKLTMGFLIAALSYGILFLIPDVPADQHVYYYLFSLLLLSIAEIHISPVIYSTLTRYGNPKYLAILMSLSFVPAKLFSAGIGFFNDKFSSEPIMALQFSLIVSLIIGLGLVIYIWVIKKQNTNQNKTLTS